MSTQPDVLVPGSALSYFVLDSRLADASGTVWKGRDTRTNRPVRIAVLSRFVPRERAKRDALLRDVRNAAAIRHSNLAEVYTVEIDGDTLFVASEVTEGESLATRLSRGVPSRSELLKFSYQIADALVALHASGRVHGELTDANVIITPENNARVTGLGVVSLLAKRVDPSDLQHRQGSDLHAAQYYSPEEILGKPIEAASDIFSVGVLLYQMAAGRLPFTGGNVAELAASICRQSPAAPQLLNPSIDAAVVNVIGRCLQKEPSSRFVSAAAILDALKRMEPNLAALPSASTTRVTPASAAPKSETVSSIVFIGELPYQELLRRKNPERALRLEAKMQQVLGEAVYLFDGEVLDSFGPRMVAQMPTTEAALDAARRALSQIAEENAAASAEDVIEPRLVLHAGELVKETSGPAGSAVDLSISILEAMEPMQLLVSERVFSRGGITPPAPAVATFQNIRFFDLPKPEPIEVAAEVEPEEVPELPLPIPQKALWPMVTIAAGVLVIAIAAGYFFFRSKNAAAPSPVAVQAAAVTSKPAAATSTTISFAPFTVEAPEAAESGEMIRLASTALLRGMRGVQVINGGSSTVLSAKVRKGATGVELVPIVGAAELSPIPLGKPGETTSAYVGAVAQALKIPEQNRTGMTSAALDAFARALALSSSEEKGKQAKAVVAIREAVGADSNFVPAQQLAVELLDRSGDRNGAVAAAQKLVALDPSQVDVARRGARWLIEAGEPGPALDLYGSILKSKPHDSEALTAFGQYALSIGDAERFNKALGRLSTPADARLHAPDAVFAVGKIDVAAQRYYDVESQQPDNAHLALKIGRIAVLRRSSEIPQIELKKLEKLDPGYGAHVLKAYLAAQSQNEKEAATELDLAFAAAQPGDDVYTSAAEVYAMLSRPAKAIQALKVAVGKSEPTGAYILANPLFRYLQSEKGFSGVRSEIDRQAAQVSQSLQSVAF